MSIVKQATLSDILRMSFDKAGISVFFVRKWIKRRGMWLEWDCIWEQKQTVSLEAVFFVRDNQSDPH
jgi:hypothetical protein